MVDWSIILCANNHKTENGTGTGRRTVTLPAPRFFFENYTHRYKIKWNARRLEGKSTAKQVCILSWLLWACTWLIQNSDVRLLLTKNFFSHVSCKGKNGRKSSMDTKQWTVCSFWAKLFRNQTQQIILAKQNMKLIWIMQIYIWLPRIVSLIIAKPLYLKLKLSFAFEISSVWNYIFNQNSI